MHSPFDRANLEHPARSLGRRTDGDGGAGGGGGSERAPPEPGETSSKLVGALVPWERGVGGTATISARWSALSDASFPFPFPFGSGLSSLKPFTTVRMSNEVADDEEAPAALLVPP